MNLGDLRGWMRGQDCLVVAPGPSSLDVPQIDYASHWTVGCNRALPYCQADFALCREPQRNPCWRVVKAAAPLITFTHLGPERRARTVFVPPDVRVLFNDARFVTEGAIEGPITLEMSPFWAAAIAAVLGFETIGIVGVDLGKSRYPDPRFLDQCNEAWERLASMAGDAHIVNLNRASRLRALPFADMDVIRRKS